MLLDRVPPHDIELEKSLLGTLMLDPEQYINIANIVTAESFYKTTHQKIYRVIELLIDEGRKIDPVTIFDELKKDGSEIKLSEIAEIMNSVATGVMAEEYALRIKEKADRRRIIRESAAAMQSAFDPGVPVTEIVAQVEKAMMEVATTMQRGRQDSNIKKLLIEVWEDFVDNQDKELDLITTGFYDLDRLIGGLVSGSTTIIGGRPGMGKTSLALDLCRNFAAQGKRALLFSLEQDRRRIVKKLISQAAMVNHFDFAIRRKLTQVEIERVYQRFQSIVDMRIGVLDGGWNVHEIRRRVIQEKRKNDCDVVLVDYVQLLAPIPRMRFETRSNELNYYSYYLQQMAIELDIRMILLSQLGRELEKRVNKKPLLTDLKESGGLEQNCDIVLFIYKESEYNPEASPDIVEIIVAKNRDGATGSIELSWISHAATFRNLDKRADGR